MALIGKKKEKGILVKDYTLWTKKQIEVLAYFSRNNNKPQTYMEIARAYVRSNYNDYKRACDRLMEKGYLERLESGKYKVKRGRWSMVKCGKEVVERPLPYFETSLKELKKRKK